MYNVWKPLVSCTLYSKFCTYKNMTVVIRFNIMRKWVYYFLCWSHMYCGNCVSWFPSSPPPLAWTILKQFQLVMSAYQMKTIQGIDYHHSLEECGKVRWLEAWNFARTHLPFFYKNIFKIGAFPVIPEIDSNCVI